MAREARAVGRLEAPHGMATLARELSGLGDRQVTVGRELTKQFEEIATLDARGLPDWLAQDPHRLRGEFALVVHPHEGPAQDPVQAAERVLGLLLAALPLKPAVRLAA